jgi:UMF1 family MFS transporter
MIGPLNAFTRSTYSRLIPRGREASFFSLYQLTDKGSAWIGPLLLVAVQQATGSYRDAMSVIAVFFVIALAIMITFDDERARVDARRLAAATSNQRFTGGDGGMDGDTDVLTDSEQAIALTDANSVTALR